MHVFQAGRGISRAMVSAIWSRTARLLTPLGVDQQFYAGGFSQWFQSTIKNQHLLLSRLNHNRRPISQYLSDTLHNLGSVIPRPHYSVATQFGRVLQHQVKSFQTGPLTQVCEQRDVAADERLQAGANGAEDGTRAHHNAAHHPQGARDPEAIQLKLRRDHVVRHHPSAARVACCHSLRPPKSVPLTHCSAASRGEQLTITQKAAGETPLEQPAVSWPAKLRRC